MFNPQDAQPIVINFQISLESYSQFGTADLIPG
jgi:hypothetical protein